MPYIYRVDPLVAGSYIFWDWAYERPIPSLKDSLEALGFPEKVLERVELPEDVIPEYRLSKYEVPVFFVDVEYKSLTQHNAYAPFDKHGLYICDGKVVSFDEVKLRELLVTEVAEVFPEEIQGASEKIDLDMFSDEETKIIKSFFRRWTS